MSPPDPKRIGILGLGREGHSVMAWLQRSYPHAELLAFDDAPQSGDRAQALAQAAGTQLDWVVKSPGIPLLHPCIAALQAQGTLLTSASRLFFAHKGSMRTIVVTGTKGKSTTAALLHHLLRAAGLRVELAGNIGVPLTDLLDGRPAPDWVVCEMSSYQLADFDGQPEIALITNLKQEHLDWHGSVSAYHAAKLEWATRSASTCVWLDRQDQTACQWSARLAQVRYFNDDQLQAVAGRGIVDASGDCLLAAENSPLPGLHNLVNLCAAMAVVRSLGLPLKQARAQLRGFAALPHRLQELGTRAGVLWVNDSISTTPDATWAALSSYPDRPRWVIIGGQDRGLDWSDFCARIAALDNLQLLLLPGLGERLAEQLPPSVPTHACADLQMAVATAASQAAAGSVVLLSPGAPSYDRYRNFEERGDCFARFAGFQEQAS